MINALKVGYNVARYRGGIGQWAWAVHRVSGLGVLLFLALHIVDIFLAGFGPQLFNDLLFLYKGPIARVLEVLLTFGLLYHALNGLRLIVMDFFPLITTKHEKFFYAQLIVFLALFIPAGTFMLREFFGVGGALLGTLFILALPAVLVGGAMLTPTTFGANGFEVSEGNYLSAVARLVSKRPQPHSRFEFYAWLFMRISGVLLIALALFHMFWMHFVIGVEQISFKTIVERWTDPAQAWFWRPYDVFLLAFAFTHGVNGARMVFSDYFHSTGWRRVLMIGLLMFWLVLIAMGLYIIFTFTPGTLK